MPKLSALSLLLAASGLAQAATQTVDCGRLLDVKAGKWVERVSVVVENGSVKSVGPMTQGVDHIDLSKHSCMPGLIDMHVHLTGETQPEAGALRDALTANAADKAYDSGG